MVSLKKFVHLKSKPSPLFMNFIIVIVLLIPIVFLFVQSSNLKNSINQLENKRTDLESQTASLSAELKTTKEELTDLKNQDQYLINKDLESQIKSIETTYTKSIKTYENLLSFQEISKKTSDFEKSFASAINMLSERNYASAEAELAKLDSSITQEKEKIASTFTIPENLPTENAPPDSGYRRQRVTTDVGTFMVDVITADLSSTKVIVDTASEGDCNANCPVLSLADYVSRNGAFAGVNGSYFCPASYPTCAGKENSFDTLLMNKNKVYFNSDNNVYSTVPAVIFGDSWIRFIGQSLEWGRDTGVNSVIANQPLLVSGGNVVFGGDGDPKKGSKGGRSFVANQGSKVYIGVVFSATVAESARVLKALGMENALNLDSGGSTALWYSGYKAGPGRNIPNAILFVRK